MKKLRIKKSRGEAGKRLRKLGYPQRACAKKKKQPEKVLEKKTRTRLAGVAAFLYWHSKPKDSSFLS